MLLDDMKSTSYVLVFDGTPLKPAATAPKFHMQHPDIGDVLPMHPDASLHEVIWDKLPRFIIELPVEEDSSDDEESNTEAA